MPENDLISVLYGEYEENKKLNNTYEKLKKEKQKNDSIELYKFIHKRVSPKMQKKLICLIEKYTGDIIDSMFESNEILYRKGFNDCLRIIFNSTLT